MLVTEIKDLNKCRDYCALWVRRLNIVKTVILPKWAYKFNAFPS